MVTISLIVAMICGGMFFLAGPIGVILIGLALIAFGITNKVKDE